MEKNVVLIMVHGAYEVQSNFLICLRVIWGSGREETLHFSRKQVQAADFPRPPGGTSNFDLAYQNRDMDWCSFHCL